MSRLGLMTLLLAATCIQACSAETPAEEAAEGTTPLVINGKQPDGNDDGSDSSDGIDATDFDDDDDDDEADDDGEDDEDVNAAPTLSISQPDGFSDTIITGSTYSIAYAGDDTDDDATLNLYYSLTNTGCDATLTGWTAVESGIAEGATTNAWDTTGVPVGSYYICGMIADGTNPAIYAVSPGSATITPVQFVTVWKTDNAGTSSSTQVTLPLPASGTYNFQVDWGDSTSDTITAWNDAATTHTYASSGTYTVTIYGDILGWNFANGGDRQKLLEISAWGPLQLVNGSDYFAGATNMVITATDVLDLTGVTMLWGMFNGCTSLTTIPSINDWDVSLVTHLNYMFMDSGFNSDIGNWNVTNVQDTEAAFMNATSFNQDLSGWTTTNLNNAEWMFYNSPFDSDLSGWSIQHLYDGDRMLLGTALSTANYDALLISWAAQVTLYGKSGYWFSTSATYSAAAADARATFAATAGGFSDGGLAP